MYLCTCKVGKAASCYIKCYINYPPSAQKCSNSTNLVLKESITSRYHRYSWHPGEMKGAGSGLQSHSGHTFVTFLYSEISCLLQLGDPKPCKLFKSNGCNKIIIDFINVLPRLKAFARDGAEAQNSALDVCEAHLGAGHVLGWSLNQANSAWTPHAAPALTRWWCWPHKLCYIYI